MAEGVPIGRADEQIVRRLWWAALDTLQEEILPKIDLSQGLWLASPLPALYEPRLLDRLNGWVWAPDELGSLNYPNASFLLPARTQSLRKDNDFIKGSFNRLPLQEEDGHDPLLIIITPEVQFALALQGQKGERNLLMRSDPETLTDLLTMLDRRLDFEDPIQANQIRQLLANLGQLKSNEDLAKLFWPLLSSKLAGIAPSLTIQPITDIQEQQSSSRKTNSEISLLEALTHEVLSLIHI